MILLIDIVPFSRNLESLADSPKPLSFCGDQAEDEDTDNTTTSVYVLITEYVPVINVLPPTAPLHKCNHPVILSHLNKTHSMSFVLQH